MLQARAQQSAKVKCLFCIFMVDYGFNVKIWEQNYLKYLSLKPKLHKFIQIVTFFPYLLLILCGNIHVECIKIR